MDKHLSSKPIVDGIYENIKVKLEFIFQNKNKPCLSIIIVGEREDSKLYVNIKKKKCHELGIDCNVYSYDINADESDIINKIKELNNNDSINGIMVQLPLPEIFNSDKIISEINVKKDVDGLFYLINLNI